tara:strand:+ start:369 stop:1313 length:945 start_codon:yes stop_codon:yes gene_type:complete
LKIVKDKSALNYTKYSIATIGYFDGIHLGHKKIIKELVNQAKLNGGKSVLITFWPHPKIVLKKDTNIHFLLSKEDKYKFLKNEGIDIIYLIEFTKDFSKVKAEKFIQEYLVKRLKINKLIIGYNHCFGYNREGNFNYLEKNRGKYHFNIQEIKKEEINNNFDISSSSIRKEIHEGNLKKANVMLGYNFFIKGKVIKGDGIGKKIGYPTANILLLDKEKIIPGNGVYVCKIFIENKYYGGMLNIGFRPTVNGKERRIEIHIFGLNYDLYDKILKIILIHKIRDEIKFTTLDELKVQLGKDKIKSIKILENEKVRN